MRYGKITKAIFNERPNRFVAFVDIDGKEEKVHVKNTGRCKELLIKGVTVILEEGSNPERKTKYSLIAVYKNGMLINMDSQSPNAAAYEALEKGIITAIGSDAPITVPNPMMSIYGALLRRDFKTLTECGPNQKVDIMDIIRMFTINGAYVSFEEDIKGSLEVGKLADIIMLEDDILTYNPEDILNLKVEITMVDGKIVYER